MAKVLLFSDLHGHPFKPYATLLSNGMNSRLADAVSCVKQVHDIAIERDVELVLFGGDMFHVRKNIPVAAFNSIYQEMAKFSLAKIPVLLDHGNHDQADREGEIYSVYAFSAFLNVVESPGWVYMDGAHGEPFSIMALPYTENLEHMRDMINTPCEYPEGHRLLLGHLGIQGAEVGADFVYRNPHDATIEDLQPSEFDAVYLGHYHKHQQLAPNAWYIGAPLQHNWGDRGDRRGCLIYDTETKIHERIYLQAPEFVQVTEAMVEEAELVGADICPPDNYLRVVSNRIWSEDEREALRVHAKLRSVEIILERPEQIVAPRMQVDPSLPVSDLLVKYVHSGLISTEGLDEDYLLQIGHEIMQEVDEVES